MHLLVLTSQVKNITTWVLLSWLLLCMMWPRYVHWIKMFWKELLLQKLVYFFVWCLFLCCFFDMLLGTWVSSLIHIEFAPIFFKNAIHLYSRTNIPARSICINTYVYTYPESVCYTPGRLWYFSPLAHHEVNLWNVGSLKTDRLEGARQVLAFLFLQEVTTLSLPLPACSYSIISYTWFKVFFLFVLKRLLLGSSNAMMSWLKPKKKK